MNSDSAPQLIVQIAQDDGTVFCDGYYDLPVTVPGYIAIVTDDTDLAKQEAEGLRKELHRMITALPGAYQKTDGLPCRTVRRDFDCTAIDRHYSRNVLVFVGTGQPPRPNPSIKINPHTEALTLLAPKAPVPTVPWALPTTNVGHWIAHATEFVPRILAAAGLTSTESRVFISYRRRESGKIAEQLFEELGRRNVDVFLDRFRIEVGVDFQQRILQELAHKSMAVFLESATLVSEKWTRYEIAVAKSSRIGVFAAHLLPHGVKIPDIDDSRRMAVTPIRCKLSAQQLKELADRIVIEQSLSQLRRRRLFRQNMQRALHLAGVHRQDVVDGVIHVKSKSTSVHTYGVWLPSRPAELSDFYTAATTGAGDVRMIVGPAAHLIGDDRRRLRWLSDKSAVRSFDEGRLLQVARAIQQELI